MCPTLYQFLSHNVEYHRESHSLLFNEAIWAHIQKRILGCQVLLSRIDSSICLELILHRHLGNYLLGTGESYSLTAQHIWKTLYKAMLDTKTFHLLTNSHDSTLHRILYQCIVMIYVENSIQLVYNLWPNHLPSGWTPVKHQATKPQHLRQIQRHMHFSNT